MQFSNIDAKNAPQKVQIKWEMVLIPEEQSDRPDENDEGFWPSLDPDACGYIGDADPDDIDGERHAAKFADQQEKASERMAAWERGDWYYLGVVARAHVMIPIGQGSFRCLTLDSAGLWGIESDSNDYHLEVMADERANLLEELRTLGRALGTSPDYIEVTGY